MELLMAFVLGLVQGLTEFLPISSTGHLILVRQIFPTEGEAHALAFDAVLHLATVAAIFLYFARDIGLLIHSALRMLGRLPVDERDRMLLLALITGTIPAGLVGFFLESYMETLFRRPLLVAGVLIAGSLVFAYAEYIHAYAGRRASLSPSVGFKIGLFQTLALIPGMSRSGISIAGGLILGLTRIEAARFAFLLALPIMSGAGLKKLIELLTTDDPIAWGSVIVGAITAFFVGLGAIHFMMQFMRTNTLWPFIWYRILLAGFVIALVFFG
jgi:undecaprenyl-diphosphatase